MTRDEISAERALVAAEARSWIDTPYHHRARVKGAGVDCAMILVGVYEALGLVEPIDVPAYPPDWHLHRGEEVYLDIVRRYADEIDGPPAQGDIALWKIGRAFAHGAIVLEWPLVIHAWLADRRVLIASGEGPLLSRGRDGSPRPRLFYRLRRWSS